MNTLIKKLRKIKCDLKKKSCHNPHNKNMEKLFI